MKNHFFSNNFQDYRELGIAIIFLACFTFLIKVLGLADFFVNTSTSLSFPVIFLVGLVAGFSSCMALIGGLVLSLSVEYNLSHSNSGVLQKFRPHLFFNFGRIASFAFFGGLLGALSSAIGFSGSVSAIIMILAGLLMLGLGLRFIGIFPWASGIRIKLPAKIKKILNIEEFAKEYSHRNAFILGILTFFLPCGLTQAVQIHAVSTGSFLQGALVMAMFALGTSPGLLSIGGITAAAQGYFAKIFFKFAGLVVLIFAFLNISGALNLLGVNNEIEKKGEEHSVIKADDNVQVMNMQELDSGYSPNSFTVKKDVPVKWVIDAQAPYSCASSLVLPSLDIKKNLVLGENIIEFTPKEVGNLKFSCSMGMYNGIIKVVE